MAKKKEEEKGTFSISFGAPETKYRFEIGSDALAKSIEATVKDSKLLGVYLQRYTQGFHIFEDEVDWFIESMRDVVAVYDALKTLRAEEKDNG